MNAETTAAELLPHRPTLAGLRKAAAHCRACPLFEHATQTVFGAGAAGARLLLVGEQPGDQEDIQGAPFVGPAGRVLENALAEAGISRSDVYVTNAVKHFKWKPVGKRRIHEKPNGREVRACRPWLEAEIQLVEPRVIVCLGATAAQALMGPSFRLTQHRGELLETPWAPWLLATIHPSSILRLREREERHEALAGLADDLVKAAKKAGQLAAKRARH